MRRFLRNKVSVAVLVLALATLVTGVALAANNSAPSAGPSGAVLTSTVVEIVAVELQVPTGGRVEIVGAGFALDDLVLFELITSEGSSNVIIEGGFVNEAGAFSAEFDLPSDVGAGLYTVIVTSLSGGGHVASTPLIVCEAVEGNVVLRGLQN